MPTRTTARPAPTTAELRDFLAGLGPDTDAAILRAVATVDALRAPYATASRRAHVRRVARELVVLAELDQLEQVVEQAARDKDGPARPMAAPAPATTAPADTTADTTGDTSGTDGTAETVATDAATTTVASDGSVVSAWAGQPWAFGDVPASATPAEESLDPVVIGMINQENSPVGSYPELRHAVEAAVAWVNAELGGVRAILLSDALWRRRFGADR